MDMRASCACFMNGQGRKSRVKEYCDHDEWRRQPGDECSGACGSTHGAL